MDSGQTITTAARVDMLLQSAGDPFKEMVEEVDQAQYPALAEPAVVHPFHNSVIKLRNNGMIDIFVDNDHGLRVDPKTATINTIADGEKHHLGYLKTWIARDATYNIGRKLNVKAGTDVDIEAGTKIRLRGNSIDIKSGSAINIQAPSINMLGRVKFTEGASGLRCHYIGAYSYRS